MLSIIMPRILMRIIAGHEYGKNIIKRCQRLKKNIAIIHACIPAIIPSRACKKIISCIDNGNRYFNNKILPELLTGNISKTMAKKIITYTCNMCINSLQLIADEYNENAYFFIIGRRSISLY